jgi:hypothetical protein
MQKQMLKYLELENVGPAPMSLEFSSRMNLITGDNGLGKSFLLDVAWWALTRRWPFELNPKLSAGYPALPTDPEQTAKIRFTIEAKTKQVKYDSQFDREQRAWVGRAGRPWNPGLVIYAQADGGFSVWDPARNYWKKKGNIDVQERLPGYVFSAKEVWEGLQGNRDGRSQFICNGVIADWATWIRERGDNAKQMEQLLQSLSSDGEPISIGSLMRISIDDVRDIPSIRTAYSECVPILHASAGLRRIVGLAYMLIWSWNEHRIACKMLAEEPTQQVVLLFDELENHLHPRWQRTILRSLLQAAGILHPEAKVQLIAATHSPLVLAAAEPYFDETIDSWFDLDLVGNKVALVQRPFVRLGDVSNWLTSEAFDLASSRSLEAERAIESAKKLLRKTNPSSQEIEDVEKALREARLPDIDPFWVRWGQFYEDHTKEPE